MKTSDIFAALGNLKVSEDRNWAWQTIQQNIKSAAKDSLGLSELK
jgi:hypothetical protein